MEKYILTSEQIAAYSRWLQEEERSAATLEKYLRDIRTFAAWMDGESVTKEAVTGWKEHLVAEQRAASTINAALSALNGLFQFLGWDIRAKFLKVQRRSFRDPARELSRNDYEALITTARKRGQDRLALLMETICATGIRVSELRYLTVEAAEKGCAEISLKGKIRPSRSRRLHGKVFHLADPDAGGADSFHQQGQPFLPTLPRCGGQDVVVAARQVAGGIPEHPALDFQEFGPDVPAEKAKQAVDGSQHCIDGGRGLTV